MLVVCHLVLTLSCATIFLKTSSVRSASSCFLGGFASFFSGAYSSSDFSIITHFQTLKFFICQQNVSTLPGSSKKLFQQRTSNLLKSRYISLCNHCRKCLYLGIWFYILFLKLYQSPEK